MDIKNNVDLGQYSTMGLGGICQEFVTVQNESQLQDIIDYANSKSLKIHILGGGSNSIFKDGIFEGLIIKNEISGFELDNQGILTAGGGENWDEIVGKATDENWSGIETMSLIPGTVGAAPVQNIGAYGQELSDCFIELKALEISTNQFQSFYKPDCMFGYRTSWFKLNPGKFIVAEIKLQLSNHQLEPPFYTTLQKYLDSSNITDYSPRSIRQAVVHWRSHYLPNIKNYKTAGSFFTNPIISKQDLDKLIAISPELANWPTKWFWPLDRDMYKVAAGRLAEIAGLKDWHDTETGMATWNNSALVLINENAKSYADLDKFRQKYLDKIQSVYGIKFEQEPIEI
jgi:UDP-N-acetylmuramate dehydrogenase